MPAADYRRPTAHDAALGDVDVTRTLFAILFCFWFHAHCDRFNWLTVKVEAHVNLLRRIRIRTEKRINLVDLGGRRRDDESRRTGGQTDGQTGRQVRHVNGDRSPVVGRSLSGRPANALVHHVLRLMYRASSPASVRLSVVGP